MTATQISLEGNDYPAYATLEEAERYLAPEGTWTTAWSNWSDEEKESAIIRAARFLTTLEYSSPIAQAEGPFAQALENSNALLAAFYAAQPAAEEASTLVSGAGRVASITAGSVSISYDTSAAAKQGDVQIAQSDDEIASIKLGIPFLSVYDALKRYLLHPRDTLAADQAAPFRSAPVVRYGTTRLTQQLGLSPLSPRYNRLDGQGAWPPAGSRLGSSW